MSAHLPHAPATARNRNAILAVLQRQFGTRRRVLEIGSGTGEHAVHFAAAMPWLQWQCSDRTEMLAGIQSWLDHAALTNTPPAVALDVGERSWPLSDFDALFSANTLHIMAWPEVEAMFAALPDVLAGEATVVIYGPFNYGGRYTSDSNAAFDSSLRAADPRRGIRDFEAVDALARVAGLVLVDDVAMPANNRCLAWRRGG
jgi:SAM-dependent methyltransferase